jgi:hypothetical protein
MSLMFQRVLDKEYLASASVIADLYACYQMLLKAN